MKIRLTRKLAQRVNGVNLSDRSVGDVFEIASPDARLLIAEGWATAADDKRRPNVKPPLLEAEGRSQATDTRSRSRRRTVR